MIKKERHVPLKVLKLEALLRRLIQKHPKRERIEDELARAKAGYKGELSVDYHLDLLPQKEYLILHDIRLEYPEKHYFQLDTLILSPYYFIILEIKNLSGTLYFDEKFDQLIRTKSGKREAFENPISQVNRQKYQLSRWLQAHHKFSSIPIIPFVVISNPSTIIEASHNYTEAYETVAPLANLHFKLINLENKFKQEHLSQKELNSIARSCIKNHIPLHQDVLQLFDLSHDEILTGVHCPNCLQFKMERTKGSWICPHCSFISQEAHLSSLEDYYLLINNKITNKTMRSFLELPSIYTASRLLKSMHLQYSGENKFRQYELNFPQFNF